MPPTPAIKNQGQCIGYHSEFEYTPDRPKQLTLDLLSTQTVDSVVLVPATLPANPRTASSYGFPKRFTLEIDDDPSFQNATPIADFSGEDFPDPGPLPVAFPHTGPPARYLRLTVHRLGGDSNGFFFALGEIFVFGSGRNLLSGMGNPGILTSDSFGSIPTWRKMNAIDGQSSLGPAVGSRKSPSFGWRAHSSPSETSEQWVCIRLDSPQPIDEIRIHPAQPSAFPWGSSYAFPRRFVVEGSLSEGFEHPVPLLQATQSDFPVPGTSPVCVRAKGRSFQFLRVKAVRLSEVKLLFECAFSEIEVFSQGRNIARGAAVTASSSDEILPWGAATLTDGFTSEFELVDQQGWLEALSLRRTLEAEARQRESALARQRARFSLWLERGLFTLLLGLGLGVAGHFWRARLARRREIQALRERIARDLHDEIGSNLGTIAMLSQMSLESPLTDPQLKTDLTEIGSVAQRSVDAIRDLVWLLKRESARRADLLAEMQITAQSLLHGIPCTFSADSPTLPAEFPFELRRNLFLAFKEILHNAAKHSRATSVRIHLAASSNRLQLEVCDDGRGFDPASIKPGVGLPSLEARAASAGGSLLLESAPGQGTRIRFELPILPRR
jgi:signal transduction histidine kinase